VFEEHNHLCRHPLLVPWHHSRRCSGGWTHGLPSRRAASWPLTYTAFISWHQDPAPSSLLQGDRWKDWDTPTVSTSAVQLYDHRLLYSAAYWVIIVLPCLPWPLPALCWDVLVGSAVSDCCFYIHWTADSTRLNMCTGQRMHPHHQIIL